MREEIKSIADGVIESVKSYVGSSIAAVNVRLDVFEEKIKSIPAGAKGDQGEKGLDGRDGENGKDADEEIIIAKVLSAIPTPSNGKDGLDGKDGERGEDGKDGKDGLNGKDADESAIIERVFAKLLNSEEFMQKMAEFSSMKVLSSIELPKDGKDGRDGIDGKDADNTLIVEKVLEAIPVPQDGKSVTVDDVAPLIDEMVTKRVAEIPAPKDGKDGKDADMQQIENAIQKAVSDIWLENDIPHAISKEVETAVAAIPKPENGKDGTDGQNGRDGKDADVEAIQSEVLQKVMSQIVMPKDGIDGKDGASVTLEDIAPIIEAKSSQWQLDFERRAYDLIERAVDKFPKPEKGDKGADGSDGFGIESFEQKDERTVIATYRRGDEVVTQEFKFPAILDRGVFKSGNDYEQGDGVTYGGSFWIAQKDTNEAPGNSDSWRLAVKRGRDGKDANNG